jgi:hypothetical protein
MNGMMNSVSFQQMFILTMSIALLGTDTFLCTYHGTSSDILPNDQATQKILIPEIRKSLKNYTMARKKNLKTF